MPAWTASPGATSATILDEIKRILGIARPEVVLMTNALTASSTDTTVTLDSGEGGKITVGAYLETDDFGANGAVEGLLVRTRNADSLTVRRAYGEANELLAHVANTYLRISPRFSYRHIVDEMFSVAQTELWPWVWIPGETTLAYQASSENYSPTATDIAKINYAYQVSAGLKYRLHAEFIPREFTDNNTFPNGMVVIRHTVDASTIYLSYQAIPVVPSTSQSTNTAAIDRLIAMGASGKLQRGEEATHVGPSRSAVAQRIQGGDKTRAGRDLWAEFLEARSAENVRLLALLTQGMDFDRGL